MSDLVRPNLSKKNKYYISKHRYYELKHFCLQYNEWKEELRKISVYRSNLERDPYGSGYRRPIEDLIAARDLYLQKVELVEKIAGITDPELSKWILEAVTQDVTFTYLQQIKGIPCCRGTFYDRYRKFFYILGCSQKIYSYNEEV